MIICFMGWPGGGKSYDAMNKILDNIQLGRNVYTNIDGCDDKVCQEHHKAITGLSDLDYQTTFHFLTKEQVFHFWDFVKPGSLIVIDEIHNFFGNRDWDTQKNKDFVEWASTHRHYGFDLVMLTQHLEKVDKHVRSCTEWTYEYRKINFLGSFIKNRYIVYSYQGDSTESRCINKRTKSYIRNIFGCYKSYVTMDMKEQGFMKHVNILKHPVFFAIPIVLAFALYMVFHSSLFSGDLFGTKKNLARHTAVIAGAGANSHAPAFSKSSSIVVRSKPIEFRELKEKVKVLKSDPVFIQEARAVIPSVPSCAITQTIVDGDSTLTVESCPDGTSFHKRDGVVVYSHKKRLSVDLSSRGNVPGVSSSISQSLPPLNRYKK